MTTEEILAERATTHGSFQQNADVMQFLKVYFRQSPNWSKMENYQRESLDCFALKMGRILTGRHKEPDHWRDVAGYATLTADLLDKVEAEK